MTNEEQKPSRYSEMSAEQIERANTRMGDVVCALLGFPRERLQSVESFDAGYDNRTGIHFNFVPKLTPEEEELMTAAAQLISAVCKGRPPIIPGKA